LPNKKAVIETKARAQSSWSCLRTRCPVRSRISRSSPTSNFYDGTKFHRVIPNFMFRGRVRTPRQGKGPVGYPAGRVNIKCERRRTHTHVAGRCRWRTQGKIPAAASFSSVISPAASRRRAHVFGAVTKGMDVVNAIKGNRRKSLRFASRNGGRDLWLLVCTDQWWCRTPGAFVVRLGNDTLSLGNTRAAQRSSYGRIRDPLAAQPASHLYSRSSTRRHGSPVGAGHAQCRWRAGADGTKASVEFSGDTAVMAYPRVIAR